VFVKIPVTNTKGLSSYKLISKLSNEGIKLNVTAVLLQDQVNNIVKSLNKKYSSPLLPIKGLGFNHLENQEFKS
jgi:transaldolase